MRAEALLLRRLRCGRKSSWSQSILAAIAWRFNQIKQFGAHPAIARLAVINHRRVAAAIDLCAPRELALRRLQTRLQYAEALIEQIAFERRGGVEVGLVANQINA
jgi:hypothetical protein